MNVRKLAVPLGAFLLLALPAGSLAAVDCPSDTEIGDCLQKLVNEVKDRDSALHQGKIKELTESTVEQVSDEVKEEGSPAINPGSASALRNMLPSFLGALGFEGLSESDGNLSFDKPFDLGLWRLSLNGVVRDPQVFDSLLQAMPEELRADQESVLKNELGDFDQTDVGFTLSLEGEGRRFGRDAEDYQDLFSEIFATAAEVVDQSEALRNLQDKLLELSQDLSHKHTFDEAAAILNDDRRYQALLDALDAAVVEQVRVKTELNELVTASGIDLLGDLINNQPHFLFEGARQFRGDGTGPDGWEVKLSYEMGVAGNVNDLLRWAERRCGLVDQLPDGDCLQNYLKKKPKAAEKGNRLKFEASYRETDRFAFTLPDDGFEFLLDPADALTGALTYGRYFSGLRLSQLTSDEEPARFDLEAKVADVSTDPMRQDRFTATATLSQKLTNGTVFSISAVYANKPEFRGDVDEEVSARFGFKWEAKKPEKAK